MDEMLSEIFGIWYLIGAVFVFFMQAGFAMVESGFTRIKNAGNILMKNLMDFCLGTVAFLILGYSFLCGQDFMGLIGFGENPLFDFIETDWASFTFNLVFCATAATIVSGAMAERTKFLSYCIYSFVISLVVYPIEAHWIWGGGWLSQMGFHDFTGSAAIHFVGGLTALIGAKMLGPRIGKYDKDGKPRGIPGHNLTIGALGVFILWFGWYGFNGATATNGLQLATIFATTTVAPALATCTVMIFTWLKYGKPDVSMSLNGSLAGLVATTAGCDAVDVFGASMIGILSGFTVCFFVWLLDYKLKIDDPVGAVAVHFGNDMLGTICVGLFACGTDTMPQAQGLFYGGGFQLLFTQCIELIAVGAWTAITMTIVFLLIKKTVGLRVTAEEEMIGLDKLEHGLESAYAGFSFETESYMDKTETIGDTAFDLPVQHVTAEEAVPVKEVVSLLPKMSKVVIITKPEKLDRLQSAMHAIGIGGMTVTRVMGCGVQKGQVNYYRGAKVNPQLLPKIKAEIVVSEIPVEVIVDTAKKALYTGHMGDGKIFVYYIENVIRISSGQQGKEALQYDEK